MRAPKHGKKARVAIALVCTLLAVAAEKKPRQLNPTTAQPCRRFRIPCTEKSMYSWHVGAASEAQHDATGTRRMCWRVRPGARGCGVHTVERLS